MTIMVMVHKLAFYCYIGLLLLAMLYAVHVLNRVPLKDVGQSLLKQLSWCTFLSSKFQDLHI